jgi:hypothetical protein
MASRDDNAAFSMRPAAGSARELIGAGDDEGFLRWAYVTLLGRPADPEGLNVYLRQMAAGKSKVSILKQLSRSDEGRAHGARLPDLDGLIRGDMWTRVPVVGRFLSGV